MKPNTEQAQAAFSVIDQAVSRLDCKGLTLVQARDLITALQTMAAFITPEPAKVEASAEAPAKP